MNSERLQSVYERFYPFVSRKISIEHIAPVARERLQAVVDYLESGGIDSDRDQDLYKIRSRLFPTLHAVVPFEEIGAESKERLWAVVDYVRQERGRTGSDAPIRVFLEAQEVSAQASREHFHRRRTRI